MGRSGLFKVIYFNTVVSIYQSSVNSCLNIMTQIFDQKGYDYLGNVSVFLIFFFCLVGNFSCVTYVKKYPYRWMVFLHAIGYLFFLAEGILVTYCKEEDDQHQLCSNTLTWILVVSGSSVTGFMASGFWVCQNDYISEAATTAEVGLFFGVGWALVQTSQLTGSLYSTYVITALGQFKFFCVMFGVSLFASMFYLLIPQPQSKNEIHSSIQSELQYDANYKLKNSTVEEQLTQFFEIVKHPKVMLINFPIMITGILLGFQYNVMHVLIENSINTNQSDEEVNSQTLKVITALGAMEVVGGVQIYIIKLVTGWLNNKFKKVKVLLLLNQLFEVALLLALLNFYVKNYTLCFVIAAVWGFVDCGTTTTLLALLSEHYGDDVRIYCNFNFFQCVGGILQTIISIVMKNSDLSNILLVLLGAQIIANMCIQMWSRKYSS